MVRSDKKSIIIRKICLCRYLSIFCILFSGYIGKEDYLGIFFCPAHNVLRRVGMFVLLLYILPIVIMDPDQFCLQNDEQRMPYELTFRKHIICRVKHGIWWHFVEMVGEDKH